MSQIDPPIINFGLIMVLIVVTLLLAAIDFMIGVALLTMLKGLHIMYKSLSDEVKELKNSVAFLIQLIQRQ